ncbi:MipA/OmpV family protein [Cellvibrio sp.]|uniref:MipA/OmpV family protein n=1 Tax=Cellvibrio sp. TaxID=1965322 RepID=UPI00396481FD
MIIKPCINYRIFAVIGLLIFQLASSSSCRAEDDESRWQFSVALGLGVRTNPVMDNKDIPLLVLPQFSYQGDRFFIQNLDLGFRLAENNTQALNLLVTPSYDQIFFNEWDISNFVDRSSLGNMSAAVKDSPSREDNNRSIDKSRLHDRDMAALAGLEYNRSIYDLNVQLQAFHEVTGYYDGNELRLGLSKDLGLGKHDVKLTIGANWQDSATINYFYGLPEKDSPGNFSYRPMAGLTGLLRFDWSYELDEHWSLRFFTSYRHLSHSISNSPLVTQNNVITVFAGGVYHF